LRFYYEWLKGKKMNEKINSKQMSRLRYAPLDMTAYRVGGKGEVIGGSAADNFSSIKSLQPSFRAKHT